MAITTVDTLVAGFAPYPFGYFKTGFVTQAAGAFTTLWTTAGQPGAGANASSGVAGDVPTSATAGAFPFTNSNNTYLTRIGIIPSQIGSITLYDRLWHNSGLSVTTTGAQTVNSVALTRGPGAGTAGEYTEVWLDIFGVLGAGSTAKTLVYTNSSGTGSKTATLQNFVTTAAATRAFKFSLAAGDSGVRSIQSFDNVATSTSGTFGLVIRRPIATLMFAVAQGADQLDVFGTGMPRIYDSACLEFVFFAGVATTYTVNGSLSIAQG